MSSALGFRGAVQELDRLHHGHLNDAELGLLALAYMDSQPLHAGTSAVDGARLVHARRLVEQGMTGREALAEARQSEGLHEVTLDDALRIEGLRRFYVDPYVTEVESQEREPGP